MAWFNSFSALGECTYFHFMPSPNALFFVARLLQQLLISFLTFSSALNFILRLLLHCLFSFLALSYRAYWRYLNAMVWMFPFSFHLPNCVLPYTVKNFYRIPVFFFTKPFRNGKTPMLTRDFLVPSREEIFLSFEEGKVFLFLQSNFFLSVECYISLFPLFPYWIYRKINRRFLAGHRSAGQSGHKIRPLRKKFGPFC